MRVFEAVIDFERWNWNGRANESCIAHTHTHTAIIILQSIEERVIVICRSAEEILTMLLEASEEGMEGNWDGGRIVWSVRYAFDNGSQLNGMDQLQQRLQQRQMQQHHHHHHAERRKLQVRLEIQKDDIQAVLPISKVSFLYPQVKL